VFDRGFTGSGEEIIKEYDNFFRFV
jgi:hypothetical protein